MTFDGELRDLADRAEQAHVRSDGFASDTVRGRVRRARRVYRAGVAAGTVAAVGLVGAAATVVVQRWPDPVPIAATTDSPTPDGFWTTSPAPDSTASPTPGPSPNTDGVLAGWGDLGVDPAVFGDVSITDGVSVDGRAVVVGCDTSGATAVQFPVWYADDAVEWTAPTLATAPTSGQYACLDHVVATPHGLFAAGVLGLFRSDDGSAWEAVALPGNTSGTVSEVFSVGDRVTALVSRVSEAESTVAELYTTTDGDTWTQVTDGSAAVFDDGFVADVVTFAGRLVAVGSSPGGAFVPTAAAWVSSDGVVWERTTPDGAGFANDAMLGVVVADGGLVAVGTCTDTSQMCAWRSFEGVSWAPEVTPTEDIDPSLAYVQPGAVTTVGDDAYAVGQWSDASTTEPRMWHRAPGGAWEVVDPDVVGAVPLVQVEVGGVVVGFWPGSGWPVAAGVQVLTPVG